MKVMGKAIIGDPEMHGTPVFRGTRVPVQNLLDYLEGGDTLDDFLKRFPTVSRSLAIQALEEAGNLLLLSCYDAARDLAGGVKSLPEDLAVSPKYMEGFGG